MQKHVNLIDLVKSFPTNIYLQNLASIQRRTSPVKFAHLAEKSGKGSISNLSTKVLIPSTLRNVNIPPQEIPAKFTLFQQAIPSILSTAEKSSFAYRIYVGIDAGDQLEKYVQHIQGLGALVERFDIEPLPDFSAK